MRTILETNLKIILDNRLQNKGTPFPAKAGCGVPLFKDLFYSPIWRFMEDERFCAC